MYGESDSEELDYDMSGVVQPLTIYITIFLFLSMRMNNTHKIMQFSIFFKR